MKTPTYIGREFKPIDIWGWLLCIASFAAFNVVATSHYDSWIQKGVLLIFIACFAFEQIWRVVYGKVYKIVYHDTVIRQMYEVVNGQDRYLVCAEDEEELKLYIEAFYPNVNYTIFGEPRRVESFVKTEEFQ